MLRIAIWRVQHMFYLTDHQSLLVNYELCKYYKGMS